MLLVFSGMQPAQAELMIRVSKGSDSAIPIAIVPFTASTGVTPDADVAMVVRSDLTMSGDFKTLTPGRMLSLPSRASEVYYRDWRMLGQQYLLIGELTFDKARNLYEARFELFDVNQEKRLLGKKATASPTGLRALGHFIADEVYQAITGIRGAFSTQIAFVTMEGAANKKPVYRLQVSDADGQNAQVLLRSTEPLLSPSWSPSAKQLAYVSFEGGYPAIYTHEIASGRRIRVASFKGMNSAPAWSPDGRSMLMTLSKDGNSEIYRMDLATRRIERMTNHWAIDTEPSWQSNGRGFVFTSDRAGGPQIYQMDLASMAEKRLTFGGKYNARPRLSEDGKYVFYVHQREGNYHIARLDLNSGEELVLSRTYLDESPSVSPNGRMLIYATQQDGQSVLAVVSSEGGSKYYLPAKYGDVREPAWSPFAN